MGSSARDVSHKPSTDPPGAAIDANATAAARGGVAARTPAAAVPVKARAAAVTVPRAASNPDMTVGSVRTKRFVSRFGVKLTRTGATGGAAAAPSGRTIAANFATTFSLRPTAAVYSAVP